MVSGDREGQPIMWLENASLHYRDGKWNRVSYQGNLTSAYWGLEGVVSGEQGWVIDGKDNNEKRILRIDALSGQETVLDLPAEAVQQGLVPAQIRRAADGTLLVLFENENNERVYLLADDQWQVQEYPVTLPGARWARDFFLDADGALWVLLLKTDGAWQVEKISRDGEFLVTSLPDSVEEDKFGLYETLFVDVYQRLWVAGYQRGQSSMSVFNPEWKGDADELQRYTSLNSNYQQNMPTNLSLSTDGRIRAFGYSITSMDTNQQELPAPLPEWYVSLAEHQDVIRIMMLGCLFLYCMWLLWFNWRSRRPVAQRLK